MSDLDLEMYKLQHREKMQRLFNRTVFWCVVVGILGLCGLTKLGQSCGVTSSTYESCRYYHQQAEMRAAKCEGQLTAAAAIPPAPTESDLYAQCKKDREFDRLVMQKLAEPRKCN